MAHINLESVDSTNEYVKRNMDNLHHLDTVRTNYQTNGKGRNGHTWDSSNNTNLLVSMLYKEKMNPIHISLCIAYALINTLKEYDIEAKIKFPNDIYVKDEKICGILVETIYADSLKGIIVGIGLNVNDQEHCSMSSCLSKDINIDDVEKILYTKILEAYNLYQDNKYSDILETVNKLSYLKNKWIDYLDYGEVLFKELTIEGNVIIEDRNHHRYAIFINEISLTNTKK